MSVLFYCKVAWGLSLVAAGAYAFFKKKRPFFLPSLLTMIGVGGTFLTLVTVIEDLDSSTFESSSQTIGFLKGFVQAFETSLIGLISSLVAKVVLVFLRETELEKKERTSVETLLGEIKTAIQRDEEETVTALLDDQLKLLKDLKGSIRGVKAEEGMIGVVGVLQLLEDIKLSIRSKEEEETIVKKLDDLKNATDGVASSTAKAVKGFGETSAQALEAQMSKSAKANEEKLAAVLGDMKQVLTATTEALLGQLVEKQDNSRQDLEGVFSRQLGDLVEKLTETVNKIEERLLGLSTSITNVGEATEGQQQALLNSMQDTVETAGSSMQSYVDNIRESLAAEQEIFQQTVGNSYREMREVLSLLQDWQQNHKLTLEGLEDRFDGILKEVMQEKNELNSILSRIDKRLEERDQQEDFGAELQELRAQEKVSVEALEQKISNLIGSMDQFVAASKNK